MINKKIVLILPYFGRFPNYFQLYLNSIEKNPEIDWLIITDDREAYSYPCNVKVVYMTFEELKDGFEKRIGFPIALKAPYKLCDFRPAYGFFFSEYIKEYDYWGYCDADVIYGKISDYLSEKMLEFSKIFEWGHFTLIKNTEDCFKMFMNKINGKLYYKDVFSTDESLNFDETMINPQNINVIFEQNGHKVFKEFYAADVYTKSSRFRLTKGMNVEKNINGFFLWDNGKLLHFVKRKNKIEKKEYMYIHLQKRKMHVLINQHDSSMYKIIPNQFVNLEIEKEDIMRKFNLIKKYAINMHYFRLRFNNIKIKMKRKIMDVVRYGRR